MSHRVLNNTNLKASEIRDALSTGGGIVSNNTLSFFKADANVNIWSKFKPLDTTDISGKANPDFVQAFDEGREYYNPEWWRGQYQDCGIVVPATISSSISVFLENVRAGNYYWTYRLPGSPFRLTDFCSYDIDAQCPVSGELQDDYWVVSGRLTFTFDYTADLPETNLTLEDIRVTAAGTTAGLTNLTDYYLGVLFWKEVGGNVTDLYYPTSSTKLGTDTVTMELTGLDGDAYWGEFYAMPYLSSVPQQLRGDEQDATYTTLNIAPKKIYIHGPGTLVISIMNATFKQSSTSTREVQYELHVQNNNSSELTVTAQVWVVRTERGSKTENDPASGELASGSVKEVTVTVAAYTTVSFFSENYEAKDATIADDLKICPTVTVQNYDAETYHYWTASRCTGFAITWYDFDDASSPEE